MIVVFVALAVVSVVAALVSHSLADEAANHLAAAELDLAVAQKNLDGLGGEHTSRFVGRKLLNM